MGSRSLTSDTRGATLVEYLIVIAVVGVAAIGAWTLFGDTVIATSDQQAGQIAVMGASAGGGAVGSSSGALRSAEGATPPPPGDHDSETPAAPEPAFGTLLDGKGEYRDASGDAYVEAGEDGRLVHPSDISQGSIADCYLISSLGALAHSSPDVLSKGIRKLDDGRYAVTLYERNASGELVPTEVIVSSKFPSKDGNGFAFAKPGDASTGDGELWPALYEKAYAQLKGSYDAIGNGGSSADALSAITGHPSTSYGTQVSLETLETHLERGDAVVAGTLGKEAAADLPLFKNSTLYAWHAYYVTDVDAEAGTVTVRNPWGWSYEEIVLTEEQFRESFSNSVASPTGKD